MSASSNVLTRQNSDVSINVVSSMCCVRTSSTFNNRLKCLNNARAIFLVVRYGCDADGPLEPPQPPKK
eukprot:5280243-Amphidinium_carterae.1